MSDMTVGPIQTYLGNSTLSAPTINQNPVQGNVAVTLTDSNLWLVDTSKLNGQTSDPAAQFALVNLQTKYQTVVPFDNVNFNATTIAPAALPTSTGSYLQSSLPQGDLFMLTSVTGGTQLSSNGTLLTSSGASGGSTGGIASSGTSGGLSNTGSGSASGGGAGGGGGSGGGSGGSSGSSAAPGVASTAAVAGQSTPGATSNPQTTVSPQATISPQPTVNPQNPVPVPFELSPTIGLLLVLLLFSHRFVLKRMAFKPMSVKMTS
jgi:hypothetical protein